MKKTKNPWPPLVRNLEATILFENFFIFAILSILGIRLFLGVTGYPQLGGGEYHIAHLLWGGFLMAAAFMLLFVYLNKAVNQIAAVVAGIGFGMFIDELGKYVTADNNYFYRPTFALIYSIFVGLYLIFRWISRRYRYRPDEYLINALEATQEAVIHDFDTEEKRLALQWLDRADPRNRLTQALQEVLRHEKPVKARAGFWMRIRQAVGGWYGQLITKRWVRILAWVFIGVQVTGYLVLAALVTALSSSIGGWRIELRLGFFGWGFVIGSAAAFVLLGVGLYTLLQASRRQAYRFIRYSLLVNIMLVTFFIFYFNQVLALVNLAVNLTFLKAFELADIQEGKLMKQPPSL